MTMLLKKKKKTLEKVIQFNLFSSHFLHDPEIFKCKEN